MRVHAHRRVRTLCSAQDAEPTDVETPREDDFPEAQKGLRLNEDGDLIDTKTGRVINDFGATRWDVAVRALRGEIDAPPEENNERASGVILQSLFKFPTDYMFQIVGQPGLRPGCTNGAFVGDMVTAVAGVCGVDVPLPPGGVEATERMGGKYVSVRVTCSVRSPELVARVYESLAGDERIRMKF
ncbi:hypothetical protein FOA52_013984 [Chlamydomonas sp. UWO 241]|nr:hypothetical protein FOA52_013984 [Chlamydomonas sp. UWO 241]